MTQGRLRAPLELTEAERHELKGLICRHRTASPIALRARIVLLCADGLSNAAVARRLGTTSQRVGRWRRRFVERRLDGLWDEPRSGTPRKITDAQVEEVVRLTLESPPHNSAHWSTRSMAERTGLSPATIHRIWSASGLRPHRSNAFPLSNDPHFVPTVRDIVGLYMDPPDHAVVLRVDERQRLQTQEQRQSILSTQPEPGLHDPLRPPATMLLAALDAATAKVADADQRKHRTTKFRNFLRRVDDVVPDDQELHLILENSAWQRTPIILRWLVRHPHFHLHFAPTHSSWLNELERWLELLSEAHSSRGVHRGTPTVERAIRAFVEARREDPGSFVWTTPAGDVPDTEILERMLYESPVRDGGGLRHGHLERTEGNPR